MGNWILEGSFREPLSLPRMLHSQITVKICNFGSLQKITDNSVHVELYMVLTAAWEASRDHINVVSYLHHPHWLALYVEADYSAKRRNLFTPNCHDRRASLM